MVQSSSKDSRTSGATSNLSSPKLSLVREGFELLSLTHFGHSEDCTLQFLPLLQLQCLISRLEGLKMHTHTVPFFTNFSRYSDDACNLCFVFTLKQLPSHH
jgi:hypothetical protein